MLLLLALVAVQTTGLSSFVAPEDCTEACPGEESEGACPPLCTYCPCCFASHVFTFPAPVVTAQPDLAGPLRAEPADFHVSPYARQILHVPRSA